MKTTMKKFGALALALVMLLALGTTAFATVSPDPAPATLTDGEVGVFTAKDTPTSQSKTLVLEKEIRVYNVDEPTVKAPTISYAYTIAPAAVAEGTTVTDSDKNGTIHGSGVSVTVPVKAGVGTPTIANAGVVAWAATEDVDADTDGEKNTKGISIDFSSVVFTGAGIYRYAITEDLTSGYAYNTSGVTETTAPAAGAHTRYVDVYVRPATSGYTDGTTAAQWDIYGYTCFYNNTSITESDKTTAAVKTTGFVGGTSDGSTAFLADQYYTFNVTVSKTVVNDGFGAATVDFPFTVLFTNSAVSAGTIVTNGAASNGSDFPHDSSVSLATGALKGVATLKSGQQIKYVGIPNGTAVEVYETNVATGVTYTVSTVVDNGTPIVDNSVSWGTAPASAVTQAGSGDPFVKTNAYESTKATFSTNAGVDDDTAHTVAVTNTLLTISPTGLVLRYGPFALILALGVVILLVSRRRREEEN